MTTCVKRAARGSDSFQAAWRAASDSGLPLKGQLAFQAGCRGFESRLPLPLPKPRGRLPISGGAAQSPKTA